MAGKVILAVAAALCAFAALNVNASPFKHLALEQDEVMQALSAHPELRFHWINATDFLDAIANILGAIEEKIDQVAVEVESAIDSTLVNIENVAEAAARQWNATIQEWVDKANEAGVDVSVCLLEQQSLADVVAALKHDAMQCVDGRLKDMESAMKDVRALGPVAKTVLMEAKAQVNECMSKGNLFLAGACLAISLPEYKVKEATLLAQAVLLSAKVGVKAAAIVPMASLCTSKVTAKRAAQASAIVDSTVSCIRAALGQ